MRLSRASLRSAFLVSFLFACGGGSTSPADKPAEKPAEPAPTKSYNLDIPMVTYKWDPQAGDKSVSAELGGPGFTGEGWDSNMTFPANGSADAVKGGTMVLGMVDWPATLRQAGKDWNTQFNYFVKDSAYNAMLDIDVNTEYVPELATHWQISEDKSTYRFRLNPEARWSDGKEITAADVIATWKLRTDPDILEPSANVMFGKFHEPVAISKYIVEVEVKEESWQNFLIISTMEVLPAHDLEGLSGGDFLDKYQFAYTATSGPYHVPAANIEKGVAITLERRDDWWGADNPAYTGMYNIDTYKHLVVKEASLRFEKAKKGELDYFPIYKAQWWAEEIPKLDSIKRGLLVAQKFHNDSPKGIQGLAINMGRAPLDDVRIRKALQLLDDRVTKIDKLYFNEYDRLKSYWPGAVGNPDNEMIEYDPFGAVELLEQAGWTEINKDGIRTKDGRELRLTIQYRSQLSERGLTVFQESCKAAGIGIDLQLLTPPAAWKNVREKKYELSSMAWGASLFPLPESMWHSKFADQLDNNNIAAFANAEVDKLIDTYNREYDPNIRAGLIREIDGLIYNQHPYVLAHFLPVERVIYWNKFSMPEWGIQRHKDDADMHLAWWIDPAKEKALEAAMADPKATLDTPEEHNHFWTQWNAARLAEATAAPAAAPASPEDGN